MLRETEQASDCGCGRADGQQLRANGVAGQGGGRGKSRRDLGPRRKSMAERVSPTAPAKPEAEVEFILSCIGMSVGLGNIWRFPYMAYANGGAAFLIPYTILMITVGKPMYYLELVLGQFQSLGQTHAFNCFPLGKGIGVCMTYVCFFVCLYFNVLLAYALVYMVHSFKSPLPWSKCDPEWADSNCFVRDT
ncbi:hypothetical protein MTO96_002310 [Rhipicephalus appendiculatus]